MNVADRAGPSAGEGTGDASAAELAFRCPLESGLHARPASHLAEAAGAFEAEIELLGERGGSADAKSVIALVSLDVRHDEPCRLRFAGRDAAAARAALERFVREVLPGCDEPVIAPPAAGELVLPRVLAEAGVRPVRGTPTAPGIGRGRVVLVRASAPPEDERLDSGGPPETERQRALAALAGLRARLEADLASGPAPLAEGLLRAHRALARDVSLESAILDQVAAGRAAPRAVWNAGQELAAKLEASESALVRERAVDVEDLCLELLEGLCGGHLGTAHVALDGPSVLVAERLAPRQLLELDRRHLQGLVLSSAGSTSHAVILARSFGVPTLTDAPEARSELPEGTPVVVDADLGIALRDEGPEVRRHYDRRQRAAARRRAVLVEGAGPAATTRDGRRLEVAANIASAEEVEPAFAGGAEGIGLLRTEMLFLHREEPPSEEEQLAFLERVLEAAGGRPVLVRALDVGGDKPLPYLGLAAEPNPFLGRRGVRLYGELAQLVDTQLRALLRAAAHHPVSLMIPMVGAADEVAAVRRRVGELREELVASGVPCGEVPRTGIMLEVPSAAFDLDRLAEEAEFFSLGTNDLAQYFFAADRENERVAGLADPLHPSFLRFLRATARDLSARGRWVGLCGEMASDPAALPLLVGLGLDEISLAAPEVPRVKHRLASLDSAECAELLERACACGDAREVRALLADARSGGGLPLCAGELIALDSEATTRAEVIQELVELLYASFRTDQPLALEREVWEREETYSTGLGDGFAVPHCKSGALSATTLAVVRLAHPVDWEALDGQPVRCALLLAVRDSDDERTHMRTLSTLARRLVDEAFRSALLAAPDPAALLSCLTRELGLDAPND